MKLEELMADRGILLRACKCVPTARNTKILIALLAVKKVVPKPEHLTSRKRVTTQHIPFAQCESLVLGMLVKKRVTLSPAFPAEVCRPGKRRAGITSKGVKHWRSELDDVAPDIRFAVAANLLPGTHRRVGSAPGSSACSCTPSSGVDPTYALPHCAGSKGR